MNGRGHEVNVSTPTPLHHYMSCLLPGQLFIPSETHHEGWSQGSPNPEPLEAEEWSSLGTYRCWCSSMLAV